MVEAEKKMPKGKVIDTWKIDLYDKTVEVEVRWVSKSNCIVALYRCEDGTVIRSSGTHVGGVKESIRKKLSIALANGKKKSIYMVVVDDSEHPVPGGRYSASYNDQGREARIRKLDLNLRMTVIEATIHTGNMMTTIEGENPLGRVPSQADGDIVFHVPATDENAWELIKIGNELNAYKKALVARLSKKEASKDFYEND